MTFVICLSFDLCHKVQCITSSSYVIFMFSFAGEMRSALLSVSNRSGLIPFAESLLRNKFELIATDGTADVLRASAIGCTRVSDLTVQKAGFFSFFVAFVFLPFQLFRDGLKCFLDELNLCILLSLEEFWQIEAKRSI